MLFLRIILSPQYIYFSALQIILPVIDIKLFKIFTFLIAALILFISIEGDPFCLLIAYKKADSICKNEYNGHLRLVSYRYDKAKGRYAFTVSDKNGVSAEIVYDPDENVFTDGYFAEYISYAQNALYGKYWQKLTENGSTPDEIVISARLQRGIIGAETENTVQKIVAIYGVIDYESFCEQAYRTAKAVRYDGFCELDIISADYFVNITDLAFYSDKSGIASRVKHN